MTNLKSRSTKCEVHIFSYKYRNLTREGKYPVDIATTDGTETMSKEKATKDNPDPNFTPANPTKTDEELKNESDAAASSDIVLVPDQSGAFLNTLTIDASSDTVAMSYSKEISQASGKFVLTLLPGRDYLKVTSPGDWLVVTMVYDGARHIRFIGNVDRVARNFNTDDDGKQSETYTIYGSDFGKVFDQFRLYINPFTIQGVLQKAVLTDMASNFFAGRAPELLLILLNIFYTNPAKGPVGGADPLNQFMLPQGLLNAVAYNPSSKDTQGPNQQSKKGLADRVYDLLITNIEMSIPGVKVNNAPPMEGSAWDILKENANLPINEMFLETDNATGRPMLVLRPTPFARRKSDIIDAIQNTELKMVVNKYSFRALPQVSISTDDIISSNLGVSDADRFNYYLLISSGMDANKGHGSGPIVSTHPGFPFIDQFSIMAHGLRPLLLKSPFFPSNKTSSVGVSEEIPPATQSPTFDPSATPSDVPYPAPFAATTPLAPAAGSPTTVSAAEAEHILDRVQKINKEKLQIINRNGQGLWSERDKKRFDELSLEKEQLEAQLDQSPARRRKNITPTSNPNPAVQTVAALQTETSATDLLFDWNRVIYENNINNPFFENGEMTIIGQPAIRVGKRLAVNEGKPDERHYYIESYTDTWSYPKDTWKQTLTLTRGQDADEIPIHVSQDRNDLLQVATSNLKQVRK